MRKIMLINVTHSEESRVAIISDKVLDAFEIESLSREHLKGNIYKGTVHRIHPALEAAFVDIGAERDAFLPLDEICFRNLAHPPANGHNGQNGHATDEGGAERKKRRIRDLLRPGEEILVQIAKEQFANKPPTLTTFYSLPGRYLVLLPGSDDTGISRRIEGDERVRLRQLINDLQPPEGFGLIVRTAAGVDEDTGELSRDMSYLLRVWDNVQNAAKSRRAPALLYREHDIVLRTIRDFFTPDIDEIHIDNEEVFQRARDFLRDVMPGKEHVLRLYQGEQPIFSAFDVESQIESIFKRRLQLRSGASIVIDGTEALTAIDVNSGGSVRGHNPEETAFRTNLEAANEITRQMRLRDIGGLIVIDFIDMREASHIHEVERAVRDSMHQDKARHEVGRISRFGLMEISRQRLRPAAMATTYAACPMCEGHGAIRTTESAALVTLRKIHNRVAIGDVGTLRVALPSAVALYLLNQKRDELARLEQRYNTRIQVNLSEQLMPHQVEIEARPRPVAPKPAATVQPGAAAIVEAPAKAAPPTAADPKVAASPNGTGKKKRRRRGRRRGTGGRAAAAIGEMLSDLGHTLGLWVGGAPMPAEPVEPTDLADDEEDDDETEGAAAETSSTAPSAVEQVAAPAVTPPGGQSARPERPHDPARSRSRRRGRRRGGRRSDAAAGSTPQPGQPQAARHQQRQASPVAHPVAAVPAAPPAPSPPPPRAAEVAAQPAPAPAQPHADTVAPPSPSRSRRTRSAGREKPAADAASSTAGTDSAAAPSTAATKRARAPRKPAVEKPARPKKKAADTAKEPKAAKAPRKRAPARTKRSTPAE